MMETVQIALLVSLCCIIAWAVGIYMGREDKAFIRFYGISLVFAFVVTIATVYLTVTDTIIAITVQLETDNGGDR